MSLLRRRKTTRPAPLPAKEHTRADDALAAPNPSQAPTQPPPPPPAATSGTWRRREPLPEVAFDIVVTRAKRDPRRDDD